VYLVVGPLLANYICSYVDGINNDSEIIKNNIRINEMYVDDFDGEAIVNSEMEIIAILNKRPTFNSNHYVFTFAEDGFPQLTSFVKDNYCVIYYLTKDEAFVSNNDNRKNNETEIFYENIKDSEMELSKDNIVEIDKLKECVWEYFKTAECPKLIKWDCL
jgi:hypothetical protein